MCRNSVSLSSLSSSLRREILMWRSNAIIYQHESNSFRIHSTWKCGIYIAGLGNKIEASRRLQQSWCSTCIDFIYPAAARSLAWLKSSLIKQNKAAVAASHLSCFASHSSGLKVRQRLSLRNYPPHLPTRVRREKIQPAAMLFCACDKRSTSSRLKSECSPPYFVVGWVEIAARFIILEMILIEWTFWIIQL